MALSSRAGGFSPSLKVIELSDMRPSDDPLPDPLPDAPPPAEPANLRLLRRLVTALTATMILGMVVVAAAFVLRLGAPTVPTPDALTLPDGAVAHAVTRMPDGWIVTTRSGRAYVFAPDGALRGELALR